MTKQDNGGPAFPTCESDGDFGWQPIGGISYLDYAAIKAMQGLVTNNAGYINNMWPRNIVTDAYAIAEAMLAEKRRREEG